MLRSSSIGYMVLAFVTLVFINTRIYRKISAHSPTNISIHKTGKSILVLITPPNGEPVLINAGPDASTLRTLGMSLAPWQRSISTLVLTDGGASQSGGASEVISRYHVSHIVRLGTMGTKEREIALFEAEQSANTPPAQWVAYGTTLVFGGLSVIFTGQNILSIRAQNKTLAVSSTTSDGIYRVFAN